MTNNKDKVYLKEWIDEGDKIKLIYKDGDSFYVSKTDFNKAFGCMINCEKEEIRRDFDINRKKQATT